MTFRNSNFSKITRSVLSWLRRYHRNSNNNRIQQSSSRRTRKKQISLSSVWNVNGLFIHESPVRITFVQYTRFKNKRKHLLGVTVCYDSVNLCFVSFHSHSAPRNDNKNPTAWRLTHSVAHRRCVVSAELVLITIRKWLNKKKKQCTYIYYLFC